MYDKITKISNIIQTFYTLYNWELSCWMFTITPKLPGENNKEYSYRVIKDGIMCLQLEPGQSISEIELAEQLQISRTPIREVLAKLKEENLVEVLPQVGTYISKINFQLIDEATFMRNTLEKEILKRSCQNFPSVALAELKSIVGMQEALVSSKGMEVEFHRLDTQFHYKIFQENNMEHVWGAITRISTHYNRMRLLSEMENKFERAIEQHKQIIHIIENKAVDEVNEIMDQHIIEPKKVWEKFFTSESPYKHYFDIR